MAEIDLAPLPGEPPATPVRPKATAPMVQPPQGGLRAWWRKFPSTPVLWGILLLFTGAGAFLRYWRLDFQAYWTDEAHTLARMQGTFSAMLTNVGGQKFPPGWYAMLRWWCELWAQHLAHGDPAKLSAATGLSMEPNITRALSALFGTLTVPAIYFLARQFTDRKGALLVMLLAAVNPFLIYYSRDIKMYAALYFFVTLSTAIFFQWMTSRRHVIWMPLYVVTGFLMMSVDFIGGCVLGLHLLFLLTRPRPRGWDAALFAIAVGLIAWFPYYFNQNYMTDSEDPSHLEWITHYTDMNSRTIMSLPTAHVLGYLWPEYPPTEKINSWFDLDYGQVNPDETPPAYIDGSPGFDHNLATRTWPWMAKWQLYCGYGLFGVMLLGLIPWRGFRKDYQRLGSVTHGRWWWVALWIALPMLGFAATWIDENSRLYPYAVKFWIDWLHHDDLPKKIWEPRYLGFIVPAWLLWVGAAARRLPFWPVRTVVILALTGACAFSSLSNHLIYRNAPFNRVAATVMRFYDPQHPNSMVVAVPQVAFPQPAGEASMEMARLAVPGTSRSGSAFSWSFLRTPSLDINWLNVEHNAAQVKTLVLVDRDGDDVDPQITDAAIAKRLGPRWKLVDEEKFQWHYEWRFYIFHTWRLRVWQFQ